MDRHIKFSVDKKYVSLTLTYALEESFPIHNAFMPDQFISADFKLVREAAEKMRKHCQAELHNILLYPDAIITPDLIYSNTCRQCFNIRTYEWLENFSRRSCTNLNDLDAQDKLMARKVLILYGDRSNIEIFKATLNALSE